MASIYFYYNELLRQSADQAVMSGKNTHSAGHSYFAGDNEDLKQQQQQEAATEKSSEKKQHGSSINPAEMKTEANQDEDGALKAPVRIDTEATLAALQPRMNRLAFLQTAVATNLDALARSLGPKL